MVVKSRTPCKAGTATNSAFWNWMAVPGLPNGEAPAAVYREQQELVLMISGKPGFCPVSAAK